ncbi:hypothetical protein [Polynucleobacter sp. AP-Feld-500C-C5]|nr:hypothetical protein [Polynucleobacter sp. AP-Feld-500C-C5]MBU3632002.1 hypothetical protein [Polynucleobacter sp. AP-Feld-500C-C5]
MTRSDRPVMLLACPARLERATWVIEADCNYWHPQAAGWSDGKDVG